MGDGKKHFLVAVNSTNMWPESLAVVISSDKMVDLNTALHYRVQICDNP